MIVCRRRKGESISRLLVWLVNVYHSEFESEQMSQHHDHGRPLDGKIKVVKNVMKLFGTYDGKLSPHIRGAAKRLFRGDFQRQG